jgi:hypothetical protein
VAVYTAFSDESGVATPSGDFLVGGYIASESEWPWVASAWQERVLDGPPKLPYLHMTDIRSRRWREEHSISLNDAENRVSEAVRTMYSMGSITAMASVIKRGDLYELVHSLYPIKKSIPIGIDEPDYACYLAFISVVLIRVHAIYPDVDLVNFVVSRKSKQITKGLNAVREVTKEFLKRLKPELYPLLGDLIPASPELQLPLQSADLLCWHLQRYYGGTTTEQTRIGCGIS